METSKLLIISLSISLIGILSLLIISALIEPKLTKINKIQDHLINKNIKINGEVISVQNYNGSNFQILTVKDKTGKIKITIDSILDIDKNQSLTVIGKVSEYRGELQIQADKIII